MASSHPFGHVYLPGVPPRTEDMLDFIVVGGGIAGLATAWSLQKVGHRVIVLEQNHVNGLSKCQEGVHTTPTMSQIFNDWGISDQLLRISTPMMWMSFLDAKSGEEIGIVSFDGQVRETLSTHFNSTQYGELFTLFYDLAKEAGVDLHFNSKVVSIDPWEGTVICEDGLQLTADVVVGADGTESIVRPVVLGPSVPVPDLDNRFIVSLAVPADVARQDEELAPLVDSMNWTGWLGDDVSAHGVLTGPGPNCHYSLMVNTRVCSGTVLEEFPMSFESLGADFFEPRVQKLIKLSDQLSKVVFAHYEPFDNWVHESGKVVLIGEAAHPLTPSGSQDSAMCIEDAMTLSMLFSLPATKVQTALLLNVFEELRQPRSAAVQRWTRRKRELITIPHGPAQRLRDSLLRNHLAVHRCDGKDDEYLCNTYSGFVQIFGFDACEAVQDWWVKWGRSIFTRIPGTESEEEEEDDDDDDDDVPLVPVVLDAEVERYGPGYPIFTDPLVGETEDVIRSAEAHRRGEE